MRRRAAVLEQTNSDTAGAEYVSECLTDLRHNMEMNKHRKQSDTLVYNRRICRIIAMLNGFEYLASNISQFRVVFKPFHQHQGQEF